MPKLKALQSFSGPDGDHEKDAVFTVPEDRAQFLTDGRYAERVPEPVERVPQATTVQTPPRKK